MSERDRLQLPLLPPSRMTVQFQIQAEEQEERRRGPHLSPGAGAGGSERRAGGRPARRRCRGTGPQRPRRGCSGGGAGRRRSAHADLQRRGRRGGGEEGGAERPHRRRRANGEQKPVSGTVSPFIRTRLRSCNDAFPLCQAGSAPPLPGAPPATPPPRLPRQQPAGATAALRSPNRAPSCCERRICPRQRRCTTRSRRRGGSPPISTPAVGPPAGHVTVSGQR